MNIEKVDFDLMKSLETADELKKQGTNEAVKAEKEIDRLVAHLEFWMKKYFKLYRDCESHLIPKQTEYSKELQIAQTAKRNNSTIYYKAKLEEVNAMLELIRGNIREVKKEESEV